MPPAGNRADTTDLQYAALSGSASIVASGIVGGGIVSGGIAVALAAGKRNRHCSSYT